ncbi:MAG: UTP--glucose-1-phosphate uridylyltransferase GalU [Verrucomicrobiales bacterium]|nr:UTP--glucose-1-phosphate uridylyltransferase GalU [Planctomycetota bacterium]MCP5524689.1 UTP--glucose-1-phosphate uridylyltransferase GalU [Verrucomicrobiales bacterium]
MIKKAVIPAAGMGTRFLPFAKAQPKEMLPIVDQPVIQYVVEEAVAAGITDILMIIGKGKRAIEEHFDRNFELEAGLAEKGRVEDLQAVRRISDLADIHFVWQKELNGLGDAVRHARHHVNNEPFLLLLGDTLIQSEDSLCRRLIEVYERYGESVVALEPVAEDKVGLYGVIRGRAIGEDLHLIEDLVEKPEAGEAPSNLAIASRYVLSPRIFDYLELTPRGKSNEIQLTDALRLMLRDVAIYGVTLNGRRHDIGNKLDFLKTNIVYGLERENLGPDLRSFIEDLVRE